MTAIRRHCAQFRTPAARRRQAISGTSVRDPPAPHALQFPNRRLERFSAFPFVLDVGERVASGGHVGEAVAGWSDEFGSAI